ncbi:hypothetical protein Tco_1177999, partial [Tanacetum coccineum]
MNNRFEVSHGRLAAASANRVFGYTGGGLEILKNGLDYESILEGPPMELP